MRQVRRLCPVFVSGTWVEIRKTKKISDQPYFFQIDDLKRQAKALVEQRIKKGVNSELAFSIFVSNSRILDTLVKLAYLQ